MHRHHIIPKHLGGDDSEDNLTPPISIKLHALFHKDLWEELGHIQDYIAWQALSGRMTNEEARLAAAKEGQNKSILYKESRKLTGKTLNLSKSPESLSKGGKSAIKKLNDWKKQNREKFLNSCSINGKINSQKLKIKHEYNGIIYESKKDLQNHYGICNNKFYRELDAGTIKRIGKNNSNRRNK